MQRGREDLINGLGNIIYEIQIGRKEWKSPQIKKAFFFLRLAYTEITQDEKHPTLPSRHLNRRQTLFSVGMISREIFELEG